MNTNHSNTNLIFHFCLVTKYRHHFPLSSVIVPPVFDGINVITSGAGMDHLHLLCDLHPSRTVADAAHIIKAEIGSMCKQLYPNLWPGWQRGYFCATVADGNSMANAEFYINSHCEDKARANFPETVLGWPPVLKHPKEYPVRDRATSLVDDPSSAG